MINKFRKGLYFLLLICVFALICLSSKNNGMYLTTSWKLSTPIGSMQQKTGNVEPYSYIPDTNFQNTTQSAIEQLYPDFTKIKTFLLFIGHPRSGSTLLGSLLDAHPTMVIANEYNVVSKFTDFPESQRTQSYIFNQLWESSVVESLKKQRAADNNYFFRYHVPGLWQGKAKRAIQVIGDKKSTATGRILDSEKSTRRFEHLISVLNLPIKFIHIIRNPYDNIATMVLRAAGFRRHVVKNKTKVDNIDLLKRHANIYFNMVKKNTKVKQRFADNVLEIHYSKFLLTPKYYLKRICAFLNIPCSKHYINSCVKVLFKEETYTRRYIVWHASVKNMIAEKIESVNYLSNYAFEIS